MSFVSSAFLAVSMSADAFAVSLSKGAVIKRPRFSDALRMGAVFGMVEGLAPIFGWLIGLLASAVVREIDHWIAFIILCAVGIRFIRESFVMKPEGAPPKTYNIGVLILTAAATSIDAFAVGISLAFVDDDIVIAAASIGLATFTMVTIGIMTGHLIGRKVGVYAERLGGLVLILIGTKILLDHLGFI